MLLMLQSELETNKILILVKMVSISPDEVALIVNSSSFFTNKEQNSYVSAVPSSWKVCIIELIVSKVD